MLVLARQRGESIVIGEDAIVTVVDIRGDKVRLGISAPRTTTVHRKEVFDAIRAENRAAAQLQPADVGASVSLQPGHLRLAGDNGQPLAPSDEFMKAAIDEARKGLSEGGLPIGSVLVRDGKIIAAGHNRRVQDGNPIAHAEIDCLARAGRQKTYKDTILYSTLMPCYFCSGAAVQFAVPKVIVGESVNFRGGPEFMRKHGIEVVDRHDPECIDLMATFIKHHPDLWNEDIGK